MSLRATTTAHWVLAAISDLGLELQTIFNRDAVMVLPAGVNKATGMAAALDSLGLSAHEVVGIGDAENDHAFLNLSEFSVGALQRTVFITVHPDQIVPVALRSAGVVLAVGRAPRETFALFCKPVQVPPPPLAAGEPGPEMAVLWPLSQGGDAYPVRTE